jgi:hypothetical protein
MTLIRTPTGLTGIPAKPAVGSGGHCEAVCEQLNLVAPSLELVIDALDAVDLRDDLLRMFFCPTGVDFSAERHRSILGGDVDT